jgi:hypothetical protein
MEDVRTRVQEKQSQINSSSTGAETTSYINGKEFIVQDITTVKTRIQDERTKVSTTWITWVVVGTVVGLFLLAFAINKAHSLATTRRNGN